MTAKQTTHQKLAGMEALVVDALLGRFLVCFRNGDELVVSAGSDEAAEKKATKLLAKRGIHSELSITLHLAAASTLRRITAGA